MNIEVPTEEKMRDFGTRLASLLKGGEVIEFVGDIGAGKTTLTKAIAAGLGITENVQSPTFTISFVYDIAGGLRLAHYDFYRLSDAGIMADELAETVGDDKAITVVEWGEVVSDVLPRDHLTITITSPTETSRHLEITAGGSRSRALVGQLS